MHEHRCEHGHDWRWEVRSARAAESARHRTELEYERLGRRQNGSWTYTGVRAELERKLVKKDHDVHRHEPDGDEGNAAARNVVLEWNHLSLRAMKVSRGSQAKRRNSGQIAGVLATDLRAQRQECVARSGPQPI